MTGQHLSAASAAWAIAALALNTAAQDCDYDLWGPKWNYLLRATSWGRCLDAVHLLYILYVDPRTQGSFQTALRLAESIRGPSEPSNKTRRRICLEAIVLAAAVSQLIKLMVTSGIPAIRALAMVYTFSYALQFLVNASLLQQPDRSWPTNELPRISLRRQQRRVEDQLRITRDRLAELREADRGLVATRASLLVITVGGLAAIVCGFGPLFSAIRFHDRSPPEGGHEKEPGWLAWLNLSLLLLTVGWLAFYILGTYDSSIRHLKYQMRLYGAPGALILGITAYRSALQQTSSQSTVSQASPHTPIWFVVLAGALGFYSLYVLISRK